MPSFLSSCSMALASRWALAGERSRQAVSRRDWYSSSETITTGSCPARVMTIS